MIRALWNVSKKAYRRESGFSLIKQSGLSTISEYGQSFFGYSEEAAKFRGRVLHLHFQAQLLGRGQEPFFERIQEKLDGFSRAQMDQDAVGKRILAAAQARERQRDAKDLMVSIESEVLADLWKKKKGNCWQTQTSVGQLEYSYLVEWHNSEPALMRIRAEHGPQWAIPITWLLSLAEPPDYLMFDDLERFERNYKSILLLLNCVAEEVNSSAA